ncbi:MAG: hypothetical protein IPK19_16460 [Chloroflexi bacterium]|nr:hypothetical protein [Chloroflexota bacterium]
MTMPADALTDREIEILRFIAEGLSNQDIAQALILAPETVKWYNKHIFSKLHVHNRTQAAARAKALGLLNRDSSASSSPLPIKSFPTQMTSFVGRLREIAAIKEALDRTRLLTLTGLGGAGKTRLALQVASEVMSEFSSGAYFVPLAMAPSADHILWALAEYLNLQFDSHMEPLTQLLQLLSRQISAAGVGQFRSPD